MRWVILTDDALPGPGGVATWTDAVMRCLSRGGHHVAAFARARPDLPTGVVGVHQRSFARWGYLALARAARHELRRADVVVATTWHVAPPGHRGWVVCHGSDVTVEANRPRRRRRVLGRARVGAVSWFLAGQAAKLGATAQVLPSPVDATPRPRELQGTVPRRWLWCGRMVDGKGGDRFLRMVAEAGAQADLLGDGPLRGRWEALADRLGARARFHGWVGSDRVEQALEHADLLVLTPRASEGLGLVLLEAAARGVPVVGCDVGGVAEAVGPGLLLPRPDDPVDSAGRIVAWWSPAQGEAAWAHHRQRHASARTVAVLQAGR